MKKIIFFSLVLFTAPLFAGPNCINNSERSIQCNCDCTIIKGKMCVDCCHLQEARPIEIIEPTQKNSSNVKSLTIYSPENPHATLEKLAIQYMKKKYDV